MKIFCHVPREEWIVDRMGKEYLEYSSHKVSLDRIENDTDVIWLLASWCWNQIPLRLLESKKVVCTIHHEVPEKFDENRKNNFLHRDKFVNHYLTYTEETKELIKTLSCKPVTIIPHWVNENIWFYLDKNNCREKLGLPVDKFLIGSFQRDTEGSDLITPKLEKGPDILIEKINDIIKVKDDVHVVLAGWRRQYVINKLKNFNIPYTYVELPDQKTVNELYNSLDLYVVSARCEGGPQAIFECAQTRTPIISTKVGQSFFLHESCIYDYKDVINKENIDNALKSIDHNKMSIKSIKLTSSIKKYDNYFGSI
jgi:glycosyltransferase involved in cell wall biosynthesis